MAEHDAKRCHEGVKMLQSWVWCSPSCVDVAWARQGVLPIVIHSRQGSAATRTCSKAGRDGSKMVPVPGTGASGLDSKSQVGEGRAHTQWLQRQRHARTLCHARTPVLFPGMRCGRPLPSSKVDAGPHRSSYPSGTG